MVQKQWYGRKESRSKDFVELWLDKNKLTAELQKIIDLKKDLLQSNEAERILSILKDPSRMLISNEQALTGSDYLFRATEPHLSIIILSREGVDVTFIKTLISDLNISAFPNEIYEISSMLMGSD